MILINNTSVPNNDAQNLSADIVNNKHKQADDTIPELTDAEFKMQVLRFINSTNLTIGSMNSSLTKIQSSLVSLGKKIDNNTSLIASLTLQVDTNKGDIQSLQKTVNEI